MDFTKVTKNLEERGFAVSCFPDKASAAAYLDAQIDGKTVAFGGSITLEELDLYDRLRAHNSVFSHWHGATPAEGQRTQIYLSSANGLSENGEIINIDGTGNRVSGLLYGHEKVYLVIGSNKLAPDYEAALFRARNVAAPKNAQRLKRNTPCAAKGDRCYDCRSAERICRGLTVLWNPLGGQKYEIVLVDEALGY